MFFRTLSVSLASGTPAADAVHGQAIVWSRLRTYHNYGVNYGHKGEDIMLFKATIRDGCESESRKNESVLLHTATKV